MVAVVQSAAFGGRGACEWPHGVAGAAAGVVEGPPAHAHAHHDGAPAFGAHGASARADAAHEDADDRGPHAPDAAGCPVAMSCGGIGLAARATIVVAEASTPAGRAEPGTHERPRSTTPAPETPPPRA